MPPTINRENKKESQDFIGLLSYVLNFIDTITEHIPEGEYLTIMNKLKELNNYGNEIKSLKQTIEHLKNVIENNNVVKTHKKRCEMRVNGDIRMTNKKKEICPICNVAVIHLKIHQNNSKCRTLSQSKQFSALAGKRDTTHFHLINNINHSIEDRIIYLHTINDFKNNFMHNSKKPY